jgi:hypothetical protein
VKKTASLVVVEVGARGHELGESPVAVAGAGDDGVGARDSVEQGVAAGAVAVDVGTRDLGGRRLHTLDVGIDGSHLGLSGDRLEPCGVVVGGGGCGGVCPSGQGDGIGDGCLERGGLRGAARAESDGALRDAREERLLFTLDNVLAGRVR